MLSQAVGLPVMRVSLDGRAPCSPEPFADRPRPPPLPQSPLCLAAVGVLRVPQKLQRVAGIAPAVICDGSSDDERCEIVAEPTAAGGDDAAVGIAAASAGGILPSPSAWPGLLPPPRSSLFFRTFIRSGSVGLHTAIALEAIHSLSIVRPRSPRSLPHHLSLALFSFPDVRP